MPHKTLKNLMEVRIEEHLRLSPPAPFLCDEPHELKESLQIWDVNHFRILIPP